MTALLSRQEAGQKSTVFEASPTWNIEIQTSTPIYLNSSIMAKTRGQMEDRQEEPKATRGQAVDTGEATGTTPL